MNCRRLASNSLTLSLALLTLTWAGGLGTIGVVNAAVVDLKPKPGLSPLPFTNAPSAVPNYIAGAKWGTQGEAINQIQSPLSPATSAERIVTRPGFEAKLWAAEPDVLKPITMAWDARGRLWIAETIDYPNEMQPPGQGRDRIKICEDSDGDGGADKFTVFAEKLSIPSALCFANGGVIVIEGGQTLFLKDTDGDDHADERRVLFKGWGTSDTHAAASNLRYGLDNWIWGTVGYSGFDGVVGAKAVKFGMGVYRFKPDGSALEFIKSSNNNTWGLGLSEEGIVFGSTANNNASWYMPIPNRFYEAVRGWSASRMETIADSQAFYPIAQHVRQVDWHAKYTAGAGHALYTARQYPREYWNKIAFVTEATGRLIGQFRLEAAGADFVAHNEHTFLASDDEWFAPIMAEVGPDGAVWFLDWYKYIIQHNPTPAGFKTGKGNAYETALRDKRHGRIYRVTWSKAEPAARPNLANATPDQLVVALQSDNQLWRLHAQRLLVERHQQDVAPALVRIVRDNKVDELGLNPGAIHALWTLSGLADPTKPDRHLQNAAGGALRHPSAGVRRTAASVLPRTAAGRSVLLTTGVLRDGDAQVRLAALLALSEMPASRDAAKALLAVLMDHTNAADRWLIDAATAAASRNDAAFLDLALALPTSDPEALAATVRIVSNHSTQNSPPDLSLARLLALNGSAPLATAYLDGFALGSTKDQPPTMSRQQETQLANLMKSLSPDGKSSLLDLVGKWGKRDLFAAELVSVAQALRGQVTDPAQSVGRRIDAARRLLSVEDSAETVKAVLTPIHPLSDPSLASGLIGALAGSRLAQTATELIALFPKLTPAARRTAISTLLRRTEWAQALLSAVEKKELERGDLAAEHWNQLKNSRNQEIAAKARELDRGATASNADMEAVIQKLLPVTQQKGDATRGKELFIAQCAVCHTLDGQGAKVGPDLTGISARTRQDILVDIVDPNRSVEANFRIWTLTKKDGDTLSGRLDTETATSVELLDVTGQKHSVQRQEITEMNASNLSIMPAGFDQLPASDLAALLEYLAAPSR